MDAKARARAETAIKSIFVKYRMAQSTDPAMLAALTSGKLYELYVLSQVVTDLDRRGFRLRFVGSPTPSGAAGGIHSTLKFKGGPGMMKLNDSHRGWRLSTQTGPCQSPIRIHHRLSRSQG